MGGHINLGKDNSSSTQKRTLSFDATVSPFVVFKSIFGIAPIIGLGFDKIHDSGCVAQFICGVGCKVYAHRFLHIVLSYRYVRDFKAKQDITKSYNHNVVSLSFIFNIYNKKKGLHAGVIARPLSFNMYHYLDGGIEDESTTNTSISSSEDSITSSKSRNGSTQSIKSTKNSSRKSSNKESTINSSSNINVSIQQQGDDSIDESQSISPIRTQSNIQDTEYNQNIKANSNYNSVIAHENDQDINNQGTNAIVNTQQEIQNDCISVDYADYVAKVLGNTLDNTLKKMEDELEKMKK